MHKSWGWEERSRENILGTASQKCQRERQTSLWLSVKNLQRLCMNSLFLYDPGLADGLWPQGLHFVSSQWHREKLLSAFNPVMQSPLQHHTLGTALFLPRAHTAIHCLWLRCLQPPKPCEGQCIASRFILPTPSHSYKLNRCLQISNRDRTLSFHTSFLSLLIPFLFLHLLEPRLLPK